MSKQNKAGNKGVSKVNPRVTPEATKTAPLPSKRTPAQTDNEVESLSDDLDNDEGEGNDDEGAETFDHSEKTPEEKTRDEGGGATEKPKTGPGVKGGTTYVGSYQQKMRQLGPVMARATLAKRIGERVVKLARSFEGWSCVVDDVDGLAEARGYLLAGKDLIAKAAKELEAIPREWRPAVGVSAASSGKELTTGDKVSIREKVRAKYTGLLEAADMTELTVKAVAHGKVKVTTKSGVVLMLARGHVAPEASAEAAE